MQTTSHGVLRQIHHLNIQLLSEIFLLLAKYSQVLQNPHGEVMCISMSLNLLHFPNEKMCIYVLDIE